jgi:hypothetical protein
MSVASEQWLRCILEASMIIVHQVMSQGVAWDSMLKSPRICSALQGRSLVAWSLGVRLPEFCYFVVSQGFVHHWFSFAFKAGINLIKTQCCGKLLKHIWGGFALSHAAPGGNPPESCLVILVRHWPWCTFSEGPQLLKIISPRIRSQSLSQTIYL